MKYTVYLINDKFAFVHFYRVKPSDFLLLYNTDLAINNIVKIPRF